MSDRLQVQESQRTFQECLKLFSNLKTTINNEALRDGTKVNHENTSCHQLDKRSDRIIVIETFSPSMIEIYNPCTDEWQTSTIPRHRMNSFGCTIHDGSIFMVGGESTNSVTLNETKLYELDSESLKTLSPMNSKRSDVGVATLDGYIYVCGGHDGKSVLDTVEKYCPKTDEWQTVCRMNHCRNSFQVVAYEECLYAFGGWQGKTVLNSIERYDPASDRWTLMNEVMKEPRFDFGAAVLEGKVYICGGSTEVWAEEALNSVEVYCPGSNRTEYVASMGTPRFSLTVVASGGELWSIGGYDHERSPLSTAEKYDPKTNLWSQSRSLGRIKGGVTGGVVSG